MKTTTPRLTMLAALALWFTGIAGLGQGTAFTYQGRLHDNGAPANGIYDLRFTLYDAVATGNIAGGALTNANVALSNGLFSVTLDFGVGAFNGSPRWLEIATRPAGNGAFTTLSPRQPITSSPHAIRALNAATVTGSVSASQLTGTIAPANIAAGTITSAMIANGAVTTAQLADGAVTAAKVFTETNWAAPASLLTIDNQVEDGFTDFGYSVASVGTDKFVVGAPYDDTFTNSGGAAYLFDGNGRRIAVLKHPAPGLGDEFGWSVAGVGSDMVLVGARQANVGPANDAGTAHLFDTNGNLLASFASPAPESNGEFGRSVAGVGTSRVLIGEPDANSGRGRAHVFDLSGNLLLTINNPFPTANASFGFSVASVGTDKLAVAAPIETGTTTNGGVVHVFDLVGNRLATCASPVALRNEGFGWTVAGAGSDSLLIGSVQNHSTGLLQGAAYLFSASGGLLTTFTNPTPELNDRFGSALAVVGPDKVLISAQYDSLGALYAGTAYLFGLSGNLIATIGNPSPTPGDQFGFAASGLGANRIVVTSPFERTGSNSYGAAYVFTFAAHAPGLVVEGVRGGAIGTIHLADSAVTTAKIADYSILASKLPSAVINNEHLANSSVDTDTLTNGAVTAAKVFQVTDWSQPLSTVTVTNPTPASSEQFGIPVAALGPSRMLIGGVQTEAAYVYGVNGFVQRTIANPTLASGDRFGAAVAGLDADRLLVGAPGDDVGGNNAGVAYLFHRSTTPPLLTLTNPAPNIDDNFGSSVVAVGTNLIAVGALGDDVGAIDAGAVHLFNTNGVLLRTIANPAPTTGDNFSFALAALGTDKLLVGAHGEDAGPTDSGRAYLFHTNGALITTLTNPAPGVSNWFGYSVTALAPDKLLVGAPNNNVAGNNAGAAYLFGTNGALLVTFTKPQAAAGDSFGISVAILGANHVVIGATGDDTGATNAGAAYVFDLAGNWLATLPHPAPGALDLFGASVAGVGTDTVLVGAPGSDSPSSNTGIAYVIPFARYAPGLLATGVRSGSIDTIHLIDGAITASKIEAGAVGASQLADGAVTTPKLADGSVTPAKLSADVGVWNKNGTNINYTAGRVGIGTASPTSALDVNGTVTAGAFNGSGVGVTGVNAAALGGLTPVQFVRADAASTMSADLSFGAGAQVLANVGTVGAPGIAFNGDVDTGIFRSAINQWAIATAGTERMRVTANGIGIGETSPSAGVHIRLTSSLSVPHVHMVENGANGFARMRLTAGTKPYWDIAAGGANNVINFFTSGGNGDVMTLTTNGNLSIDGTLTQGSDRHRKTDIAPVEPLTVLEKVAALPLATWRYKTDAPDRKHLGPMAQDFHAAFGLNGADDKHIATVDADGVALAAIQGLNRKLEEREALLRDELKRRDTENAELRQRLERLESLLNEKPRSEAR